MKNLIISLACVILAACTSTPDSAKVTVDTPVVTESLSTCGFPPCTASNDGETAFALSDGRGVCGAPGLYTCTAGVWVAEPCSPANAGDVVFVDVDGVNATCTLSHNGKSAHWAE